MMSQINLDDAERIRTLIVDPVVDGLTEKISTLIEEGRQHEKRLKRLERNQGKALAGMAGVTAALSLVLGIATDWARRRFGL